MNYYNELDPYAAQWLRNLMDAGHIPPGYVDTRSIEDVTPADLAGYTQCHFFAGIGGWSLALQLAGWPADRPVWTGSCPCQPFSAAGKGAGFADERHLWPAWFHLIEQCQPPVIFGEQVASSAVEAWIDLVHADLEGVDYGFASIPFPAAGVGAPHIRDRNVWLADANSFARGQGRTDLRGRLAGGDAQSRTGLSGGGVPSGLANADCERSQGGVALLKSNNRVDGRTTIRMADANGGSASAEREQRGGKQRQQPQDRSADGLGDASRSGLQECQCGVSGEAFATHARETVERGGVYAGGLGHSNDPRICGQPGGFDSPKNGVGNRSHLHDPVAAGDDDRAGPVNGQWRAADWLGCRDGKWRPVEPGTFPLAHGVPNRVGRLRAYGNAIVPPAIAEFIKAYLVCQS